MAVTPAFTTTIRAGTPYYRITSTTFRTQNTLLHSQVVNGKGAFANPHGGRYNYPGVITVYLADTIEACLAEKLFYFQREVVRSLDLMHITGAVVPPFRQTFVIWEVVFKKDIPDICDISVAANATALHVIPSLMYNPSQDYWHLKQRRADIQSLGYTGIRAPSSRSTKGGHIEAVFADQSTNLQRITPYNADFRLIKHPPPGPFVNQATERLDFFAGEVQIAGNPSRNTTYNAFMRVDFCH